MLAINLRKGAAIAMYAGPSTVIFAVKTAPTRRVRLMFLLRSLTNLSSQAAADTAQRRHLESSRGRLVLTANEVKTPIRSKLDTEQSQVRPSSRTFAAALSRYQ